MLSKPTPEALVALDQVARLPRWGKINEMIDAELNAIFDRMIGPGSDAELHALRGRAAALRDFQKLVREAPATLAKLGVQAPL